MSRASLDKLPRWPFVLLIGAVVSADAIGAVVSAVDASVGAIDAAVGAVDASDDAAVSMASAAFSAQECSDILKLFSEATPEHDLRRVPLLPNMKEESFRGSRINRFADAAMLDSGDFDWIYERLLSVLPASMDGGSAGAVVGESSKLWAPKRQRLQWMHDRVAFNLVHEFTDDANGFDWHTDTKPGDGKARSLNINVMLSAPGEAFGGGELQVGGAQIAARQGDAYTYSAAVPHRVLPLTWGRRYTLIIALNERPGAGLEGRREAYWRRAEAAFDGLVRSAALASEPKVHILHGEFLEGAGRHEDAHRAFCRAYRATAEPHAHCQQFIADGAAAVQRPEGADLDTAERYFSMAACIDPTHAEAASALAMVSDAIGQRAAAQAEAQAARAGDAP